MKYSLDHLQVPGGHIVAAPARVLALLTVPPREPHVPGRHRAEGPRRAPTQHGGSKDSIIAFICYLFIIFLGGTPEREAGRPREPCVGRGDGLFRQPRPRRRPLQRTSWPRGQAHHYG